ncbi:hypothetical protein PR202_gb06488 [Eleusine coracana subsp. coracana]|uniref:Uncharacterized protein n=1 Tax=Eleusine coracana subsp. coracana TaxID=191504 RepID=A0AAV5E7Z5_ELECO|nr:hypothetical protein PR202_gb06488 [Eleusine coracana subsp. coracana]
MLGPEVFYGPFMTACKAQPSSKQKVWNQLESKARRHARPGSPSENGVRHVAEAPAMAKTPSEPASGQRDELAESLGELFTNVSLMVRGELQVPPAPASDSNLTSSFDVRMVSAFQWGTNNQLSLIEKMNDRVAQEYSNYGDVAAGLRVFVEQLNEKNQGFDEYISQIDTIDQQVTEFEAVVSMLDKHATTRSRAAVEVVRPKTSAATGARPLREGAEGFVEEASDEVNEGGQEVMAEGETTGGQLTQEEAEYASRIAKERIKKQQEDALQEEENIRLMEHEVERQKRVAEEQMLRAQAL